MENKMLTFSHAPQIKAGKIYFNKEVNRESIQELLSIIEMFFSYYLYDKVQIEINSPGGEIVAMNHIWIILINIKIQAK